MRCFLLLSAFFIAACSHTPSENTAGLEGEENTAQDILAKNLREQGLSYYSKNDYPRAISQFEAASLIAPEPPDSKSKYILYYCYLATGDYKKALSLAELISKASPYQPLVYQQVGLARFWLGNMSEAISNFLRASEFDSHSPKLHFYLGLAYQNINQPAAAERAFQKGEAEYLQILKKNPKDFTANFELASLYLYWNKNKEFVPELLKTAKNSLVSTKTDGDAPEEKNIYQRFYFPLLEGILKFRNEDAEGSIKTLFDSFSNSPSGNRADLAEVYYYLGKNHEFLKDNENAKLFLQQSLDLDPKGPFSLESQKLIRSLTSQKSSDS